MTKMIHNVDNNLFYLAFAKSNLSSIFCQVFPTEIFNLLHLYTFF